MTLSRREGMYNLCPSCGWFGIRVKLFPSDWLPETRWEAMCVHFRVHIFGKTPHNEAVFLISSIKTIWDVTSTGIFSRRSGRVTNSAPAWSGLGVFGLESATLMERPQMTGISLLGKPYELSSRGRGVSSRARRRIPNVLHWVDWFPVIGLG